MIHNANLSAVNASRLPLDVWLFDKAVAYMPPMGPMREFVLTNATDRVYRRSDLLPQEKLIFKGIADLWLSGTGVIDQIDHETFVGLKLGLQLEDTPRALSWILWRLAVTREILWRPQGKYQGLMAPFVVPLLKPDDFLFDPISDEDAA